MKQITIQNNKLDKLSLLHNSLTKYSDYRPGMLKGPQEFHRPNILGNMNTGAYRGVEFSPSDISNLIAWYDADDASTITKDGSDFVSQWDDKSTEGNDLTQATGTNQPKWIDSVQNSKPVIRFDGVDNYIDRTTFVSGALTQPTTIVGVYSFPSNTTGNEYVFDGPTVRVAMIREALQYNFFAGVELKTGAPSTEIAQYTLLANSSSSNIRKDQSSVGTGNAGSNGMNGLRLGASDVIDQFGDIDICEFLIYEKSVTGTERTDLENYLKNKWGTA